MLQHNDPLRGLHILLFHCCVLHSLFDYNLFTIVDIDALGAGLAAQAHTVERVPCLTVEREFARLGVEGADGGSLAAAADEAHGDALGQVVGGGCAGQAACRFGART